MCSVTVQQHDQIYHLVSLYSINTFTLHLGMNLSSALRVGSSVTDIHTLGNIYIYIKTKYDIIYIINANNF
jgi:hypothetical protein